MLKNRNLDQDRAYKALSNYCLLEYSPHRGWLTPIVPEESMLNQYPQKASWRGAGLPPWQQGIEAPMK